MKIYLNYIVKNKFIILLINFFFFFYIFINIYNIVKIILLLK